ncbi:hypothetical protein [Xanthobacter sediminis]
MTMRAKACVFLRMALLWAFAVSAAIVPWRADAGCAPGGAVADSFSPAPETASTAPETAQHQPMAQEAHASRHHDHGSGVPASPAHAHGEASVADGHPPGAGPGDGAAGRHAHHSGASACCGPGGCRMVCHMGGVLAPVPVLAAPAGRVLHDRRERPDPAALTAEVAVPPPRAAS